MGHLVFLACLLFGLQTAHDAVVVVVYGFHDPMKLQLPCDFLNALASSVSPLDGILSEDVSSLSWIADSCAPVSNFSFVMASFDSGWLSASPDDIDVTFIPPQTSVTSVSFRRTMRAVVDLEAMSLVEAEVSLNISLDLSDGVKIPIVVRTQENTFSCSALPALIPLWEAFIAENTLGTFYVDNDMFDGVLPLRLSLVSTAPSPVFIEAAIKTQAALSALHRRVGELDTIPSLVVGETANLPPVETSALFGTTSLGNAAAHGLVLSSSSSCRGSACPASIAPALAQLVTRAAGVSCSSPLLLPSSVKRRTSISVVIGNATLPRSLSATSFAVFQCGHGGYLGLLVEMQSPSTAVWPAPAALVALDDVSMQTMVDKIAFVPYGRMAGAITTQDSLLTPQQGNVFLPSNEENVVFFAQYTPSHGGGVVHINSTVAHSVYPLLPNITYLIDSYIAGGSITFNDPPAGPPPSMWRIVMQPASLHVPVHINVNGVCKTDGVIEILAFEDITVQLSTLQESHMVFAGTAEISLDCADHLRIVSRSNVLTVNVQNSPGNVDVIVEATPESTVTIYDMAASIAVFNASIIIVTPPFRFQTLSTLVVANPGGRFIANAFNADLATLTGGCLQLGAAGDRLPVANISAWFAREVSLLGVTTAFDACWVVLQDMDEMVLQIETLYASGITDGKVTRSISLIGQLQLIGNDPLESIYSSGREIFFPGLRLLLPYFNFMQSALYVSSTMLSDTTAITIDCSKDELLPDGGLNVTNLYLGDGDPSITWSGFGCQGSLMSDGVVHPSVNIVNNQSAPHMRVAISMTLLPFHSSTCIPEGEVNTHSMRQMCVGLDMGIDQVVTCHESVIASLSYIVPMSHTRAQVTFLASPDWGSGATTSVMVEPGATCILKSPIPDFALMMINMVKWDVLHHAIYVEGSAPGVIVPDYMKYCLRSAVACSETAWIDAAAFGTQCQDNTEQQRCVARAVSVVIVSEPLLCTADGFLVSRNLNGIEFEYPDKDYYSTLLMGVFVCSVVLAAASLAIFHEIRAELTAPLILSAMLSLLSSNTDQWIPSIRLMASLADDLVFNLLQGAWCGADGLPRPSYTPWLEAKYSAVKIAAAIVGVRCFELLLAAVAARRNWGMGSPMSAGVVALSILGMLRRASAITALLVLTPYLTMRVELSSTESIVNVAVFISLVVLSMLLDVMRVGWCLGPAVQGSIKRSLRLNSGPTVTDDDDDCIVDGSDVGWHRDEKQERDDTIPPSSDDDYDDSGRDTQPFLRLMQRTNVVRLRTRPAFTAHMYLNIFALVVVTIAVIVPAAMRHVDATTSSGGMLAFISVLLVLQAIVTFTTLVLRVREQCSRGLSRLGTIALWAASLGPRTAGSVLGLVFVGLLSQNPDTTVPLESLWLVWAIVSPLLSSVTIIALAAVTLWVELRRR